MKINRYICDNCRMSMYRYSLPEILVTDRAGYGFLSETYDHLSSLLEKTVMIDFSPCRQFDANLAAAFGAILDKLSSDGKSFSVKFPDNVDTFDSLLRNGFMAALGISTQIEEEKENFIVYQKFHGSDSDKFKQYIDEWLIKKQKFPKHTDLAGEKIQESIYEIYVNATTHGMTDYVYSCGEYKPDTATLDMTIVDCGRTIPMNVNDFMHRHSWPEKDPRMAIEWAFESGNTTKDDAGGLGLAILKEFVKLNQGCLQMVSGNAVLEFRNGGMESYLLDKIFPGTIVNVKFNFNDNKNYYMISERVDPENLL